MKWGLVLLWFLVITVRCIAQDNTVAGIVFDKDTKDRVAAVSIHNLTTGNIIYDNLKGEFKIDAKPGDHIVFSKPEYHPDTVIIKSSAPLAIYLARTAIVLTEVTIHDTVLTPDRRFETLRQQYPQLYGAAANPDGLTTSPGSGAGIGIDAIWNALSRSGRNAEHLRQTMQRDYEQNSIDYRFNRTYVGMITGLKDAKLTAFMQRYRPGYFTTRTASEYEFVAMIRANLRRFLRNQRTYSLPQLVTPPNEPPASR